jgi:hypothetical protein
MNLRWLRESSTQLNCFTRFPAWPRSASPRCVGDNSQTPLARQNSICERNREANVGTIERRIPGFSQAFGFVAMSSPDSWRARRPPAAIQQADIQSPSRARSMTWSGQREREQAGSRVGDERSHLDRDCVVTARNARYRYDSGGDAGGSGLHRPF